MDRFGQCFCMDGFVTCRTRTRFFEVSGDVVAVTVGTVDLAGLPETVGRGFVVVVAQERRFVVRVVQGQDVDRSFTEACHVFAFIRVGFPVSVLAVTGGDPLITRHLGRFTLAGVTGVAVRDIDRVRTEVFDDLAVVIHNRTAVLIMQLYRGSLERLEVFFGDGTDRPFAGRVVKRRQRQTQGVPKV